MVGRASIAKLDYRAATGAMEAVKRAAIVALKAHLTRVRGTVITLHINYNSNTTMATSTRKQMRVMSSSSLTQISTVTTAASPS